MILGLQYFVSKRQSTFKGVVMEAGFHRITKVAKNASRGFLSFMWGLLPRAILHELLVTKKCYRSDGRFRID